MNINDIVSRLEKVKPSNSGFTALCPAHEDTRRSLSISEMDNGKILMKCFTGCEFNSIVQAMDLTVADFMPAAMPEQKKIVYRLKTKDGVFDHIRIDKPGGKIMWWCRDGEKGLKGYKIENLPLYEPANNGKTKRLFICEGEKSSIAAAKLGCRALATVSGSSSCPSVESLAVCQGEDVVLWRDRDEPGLLHMNEVFNRLRGIAKSTTIIVTGDKEKDDAATFKGTLDDLEELINPINSPTIEKTAIEAVNKIMRRIEGKEPAIETPWPEINKDLDDGLREGLYTLAGPTGTGKTQWVLQAGLHAAKNGVPVLYVGLELGQIDTTIRLIGLEINHKWSELLRGKDSNDNVLDETVRSAVLDTTRSFQGIPFHIEISSPHGWPYDKLYPLARGIRERYKKQLSGDDGKDTKPFLIVLDYLQLVSSPKDKSREDLRERIGNAAYQARAVARDFNACVLLITSVARDKYEKLTDSKNIQDKSGRTFLGLGKESGEIEYAADGAIVLGCNKEEPDKVYFGRAKLRTKGPTKPGEWIPLYFDGGRFNDTSEPDDNNQNTKFI